MSQFPPRIEQERQAVAQRQAFGGSLAGRSRNASPVHKADRTAVRVPTGQTISGETFWVEDHFTVSSTSPGTFALSYVPRANSEDITVNGITLLPTTEWTRSGTTLTVDAGVWLGLTGTWDLLVQYEVASLVPSVASSVAPLSQYVVSNGSGAAVGPVTVPAAPLAGDIGFVVTRNGSGAPSGVFATWTKLWEKGTAQLADGEWTVVWLGTGVGSGTTVSTAVADYLVVAAYRPSGSTVTLHDVQQTKALSPATPVSTPAASAAVGDIVLSTVIATGRGPAQNGYFPDGSWTDAGFTGQYAAGTGSGIYAGGGAASSGIATASSVSTAFGMTSFGTGNIAELVTLVIRVT